MMALQPIVRFLFMATHVAGFYFAFDTSQYLVRWHGPALHGVFSVIVLA